jgi:hypothetical protein
MEQVGANQWFSLPEWFYTKPFPYPLVSGRGGGGEWVTLDWLSISQQIKTFIFWQNKYLFSKPLTVHIFGILLFVYTVKNEKKIFPHTVYKEI